MSVESDLLAFRETFDGILSKGKREEEALAKRYSDGLSGLKSKMDAYCKQLCADPVYDVLLPGGIYVRHKGALANDQSKSLEVGEEGGKSDYSPEAAAAEIERVLKTIKSVESFRTAVVEAEEDRPPIMVTYCWISTKENLDFQQWKLMQPTVCFGPITRTDKKHPKQFIEIQETDFMFGIVSKGEPLVVEFEYKGTDYERREVRINTGGRHVALKDGELRRVEKNIPFKTEAYIYAGSVFSALPTVSKSPRSKTEEYDTESVISDLSASFGLPPPFIEMLRDEILSNVPPKYSFSYVVGTGKIGLVENGDRLTQALKIYDEQPVLGVV